MMAWFSSPCEKNSIWQGRRRREDAHKSNPNHLEPQDLLREMKKRCAKIAGPMGPGEIAALSKHHDRIEVVTHGEYLSDVNKGRWHRGTCKSPPSGILVRSSSFMRKHSRLLGYWGQAVMVAVEWCQKCLAFARSSAVQSHYSTARREVRSSVWSKAADSW
jgi:hypothetical protein